MLTAGENQTIFIEDHADFRDAVNGQTTDKIQRSWWHNHVAIQTLKFGIVGFDLRQTVTVGRHHFHLLTGGLPENAIQSRSSFIVGSGIGGLVNHPAQDISRYFDFFCWINFRQPWKFIRRHSGNLVVTGTETHFNAIIYRFDLNISLWQGINDFCKFLGRNCH